MFAKYGRPKGERTWKRAVTLGFGTAKRDETSELENVILRDAVARALPPRFGSCFIPGTVLAAGTDLRQSQMLIATVCVKFRC